MVAAMTGSLMLPYIWSPRLEVNVSVKTQIDVPSRWQHTKHMSILDSCSKGPKGD